MNQLQYIGRWGYERPMLGGLMGQVIGINAGDAFLLGFNVSLSLFGPDAEDIAPWLERMNLAHSVVSEKIAGIINPYLSVIGLANGTWTTPSSFRDAVLAAIGELGFEIDYSSPINYQITPMVGGVPVRVPAPAPRATPRPTPQSQPSEESLYFDIVGELPPEFYFPLPPPPSGAATTTTTTPLPPPKKDGINATWLLLGFGLLAVVLVSGDRR